MAKVHLDRKLGNRAEAVEHQDEIQGLMADDVDTRDDDEEICVFFRFEF